MMTVKKLFKHGGSYAVDIPVDFVKHAGTKEVVIESTADSINIRPHSELDTLEADPLFPQFLQAIATDAMNNPQLLHDVRDTWDAEWDDLLEGVSTEDE